MAPSSCIGAETATPIKSLQHALAMLHHENLDNSADDALTTSFAITTEWEIQP